nr:Ig-like domain-containing protein [Lachnospiraceae bacterium]
MKKRAWKSAFCMLLALAMLLTMPNAGAIQGLTGIAKAKSRIALSRKKVNLSVGKKTRITLRGVSKKNSKKIRWKSSNKRVVQVNKKGYLFGKKVGKARVTAIYGRKKYVCRVTVKNKATSTSSTDATVAPTSVSTPGSASATPTSSAKAGSGAKETAGAGEEGVTEAPGNSSDVTKAPTETSASEVTKTPTETGDSDATEGPTDTGSSEVTDAPTETDVTEAPSETGAADTTEEPSETESAKVTDVPTQEPTASPSAAPTEEPTPTVEPTASPTPTPITPEGSISITDTSSIWKTLVETITFGLVELDSTSTVEIECSNIESEDVGVYYYIRNVEDTENVAQLTIDELNAISTSDGESANPYDGFVKYSSAFSIKNSEIENTVVYAKFVNLKYNTVISYISSDGLKIDVSSIVVPSGVRVGDGLYYKEIKIGDTYQLSAIVYPEDADQTVTWVYDNNGVVSVNGGLVTGLTPGSVDIYPVTVNGIKGTAAARVVVSAVDLTSITLNQSELAMVVGDSANLSASLTPANASIKEDSWTSSDPSLVSVDEDGIVRANKKTSDAVTITYSATDYNGNTKTATCKVTVKSDAVYATGLAVNTKNNVKEINMGESVQLISSISPENTTVSVSYKSSDESIATVDSTGLVKGISAGTVTITASAPSGESTVIEKTVDITVKEADVYPEGITLDSDSYTVNLDDSLDVISTITNTNATKRDVTWTVGDEEIISVTPGDDGVATIKGLKSGSTTITVTTENNRLATAKVTVKVPVVSVTLSDDSVVLNIDSSAEHNTYESKVLSATLVGTNGEAPSDNTITWVSSDTTIATVDSEGKVTAVSAGKTTVLAIASNGIQGVCDVTVKLPANSLTATSSLSIIKGNTATITYAVGPDNATDKTTIIPTFTSADESIAKVSNKGVVTAVAEGSTTIKIAYTSALGNAVSATCKVEVVGAENKTASISFSADNANVTVKQTKELDYVVKGEDESYSSTDEVTWSSSNETIATVSDGFVTGVSVGEATITAESNGKTAEITVNITNDIIAIDLSNVSVDAGKSAELIKTITLMVPSESTNQKVTYSVAEESVATCSVNEKTGKVTITGVTPGETTINAEADSGVMVSATITVNEVYAEGVTITDSEGLITSSKTLGVEKDDSVSLTATITNATTVTNKNITWKSSDTSVVALSSTSSKTGGEITATAKATGYSDITATTSNGKTYTIRINVYISATGFATSTNKVVNDEGSYSLVPGDKMTINVALIPSGTTDTFTMTSSMSEDGCAEISANDDATSVSVNAVKEGTVTITYTSSNGIEKVFNIVISPVAVESVSITDSTGSEITDTITLNKVSTPKMQLLGKVSPSNATYPKLTWSSANEGVVTVTDGLIKAVSAGETTITATTSNGVKDSVSVKVLSPTTEISLNSTSVTLEAKDTFQLTASQTPSDSTDTLTFS